MKKQKTGAGGRGTAERAALPGRDALREAAVGAGAMLLAALATVIFAVAAPGAEAFPPAAAESGASGAAQTPAALSGELPWAAWLRERLAGGTSGAAERSPALPVPAAAAVCLLPGAGEDGTEALTDLAPEASEPLPAETSGGDTEKEVPPAPDFGTAVASPYGILLDLSDGRVLRERAADERLHPASLTKIMTLLTLRELGTDLSGTCRVPADAVARTAAVNCSNIGLAVGEEVPVTDLIYAMMLPSACDAASCLACLAAGSEEEFALRMNETAARLGMTDSHFVNASGITAEGHYSTAGDLAVLLAAALRDDWIAQILSAGTYVLSATEVHPERVIRSSLSGLTQNYTGTRTMGGAALLGGKTGTGASQWRCLASFARGRDGKLYALVTCGATSARQLIDDCYFIYANYLP